jgi:Holliday junction resolvase RusA-like endonuclease
MKVKFTVLGEPSGKGRPRFSRQGPYVRTYTPEKTVNYENLVKLEYERQCGAIKFQADTPVDMRITAYYSVPKSASKKKRQAMLDHKIRPIKKPDSSNVVKAIEDALNGVAYHDDTQIVDSQVRRFYGETPRVVVIIQEADT